MAFSGRKTDESWVRSWRAVLLASLVLVSTVTPVAAGSALATGATLNTTNTTLTTTSSTSPPIMVYYSKGANSLTTYAKNETTTSLGVGSDVAGPMKDVDSDGALETVYVDSGGQLHLVDRAGETQSLAATNAPTSKTMFGVGDFDGDGTMAVFYPNTGDSGYIYKVEYGHQPTKVVSTAAKAVLGVADYDGDGDEDLIFVGSSSTIKYYDGSVHSTGYSSIGANNGIGVGAPADFDGDGVPRVPIVDGSNNPSLIAADGSKTALKSGSAAKGPIAGVDVVGDKRLELVYVNKNEYIAYTTLGDSTGTVKTSSGSKIAAAPKVGVAAAAPPPAPEISDYTVSNPEKREIRIAFNSTQELTDIRVDLAHDGGTVATLTEANISESVVDGTYHYVATYSAAEDGDYTATLEKAADADGNTADATPSGTVTVDGPPAIGNYSVTNPEKRKIVVSFTSSEQLTDIAVDVDGPVSTTLTEGTFSETTTTDGYRYRTTYRPDEDGTYSLTLRSATDDAGYDGADGQTGNVTVSGPPAISDYTVTNPEGRDVYVSFSASEKLSEITVDVDGPQPTTLTEGEFNRSGDGPYTYSTTYTPSEDGTYQTTLTRAIDGEGYDGADNQTASVTVNGAPRVLEYDVRNPEGRQITVELRTGERLDTLRVDVSGPESATLTRPAFARSGDDPYTYTTTYTPTADGEYTVTLATAADAAGNDGADGQSETLTVETPAPQVTDVSITDLTNHDGVVTDDDRVRITATVEGRHVERVTTDLAALGVGPVQLVHEGGDSYRSTVVVDAEDAPRAGAFTFTVVARNIYNTTDRRTTEPLLLDTVAPTANAGQNITVEEDTKVRLDASGSQDNIAIAHHIWSLGNGDRAGGQSVVYSYDDPGTYTVTLTVVDVAGNRDTATRTITVTDVAGEPTTEPTATPASQTPDNETARIVETVRIVEDGADSDTGTGASERVVRFEKVPIKTVVFADDPPNGTFRIERLQSFPSNVSNYRGTVIWPLQVSPPKGAAVPATLIFSVDRDVLGGMDPSNVVLLRYANGSWHQLNTSVSTRGPDAVTYTARTTGFSYFAIAVPSQEGPTNETATPGPTATETTPGAMETPSDEDQPPIWPIVLFVVLALLAVVGYWAYRQGHLDEYIEMAEDALGR